MNTLQLKFATAIIAFLILLGSTGCEPHPWKRGSEEPVTSVPLELLIVGKGNSYGLMGHVGIRLQDVVAHYCWVGEHLQLEVMDAGDYFRMYSTYEERDILGMEPDFTPQQVEKVVRTVLEEADRPSRWDPDYRIFRNNCVHGAWRLLCEGMPDYEARKPLNAFTPEGLAVWTRDNIPLRAERFYPSYRHRRMYEQWARGEGITDEFFVPWADEDSHEYECWRLVYTEDLRGGLTLARPLAGAGNILTGGAQTIKGVLTIPAGGAPDVLRGLYSMVIAVPELLFVPIRRAGKSAPFDPIEYQGILLYWKTRHEKEAKSQGM
ncbi:MAG: hypothetical protein Kow00107_09920 [Planctomycetota bacterium]